MVEFKKLVYTRIEPSVYLDIKKEPYGSFSVTI
jgi:hypothetical protein